MSAALTAFAPQRVTFSPRALDEHKLGQVAGDVLETVHGAIVAYGTLAPHRASHLANLGVSYRREIWLGGEAEDLLESLRERGYACRALSSGSAIPSEIAVLYAGGADPAQLRKLLARLGPNLSAAGVLVLEGVGEDRHAVVQQLDDLGIEILPEPCAQPDCMMVRIGAGEDDSIAAPAAPTAAPTAAGEAARGDFVVLCVPNLPRGKFGSMCEMAGYTTTNDISAQFHVATKWFGETFTPAGEVLKELSAATHVINRRCEDISKTHVEALHRDLFGYGLIVDPTRHVGPAVMKANLNAQCQESVVDCPVDEAVPGFVYQRLIVTEPEPEEFEEYRVPITGCEIPLVVIKRRPVAQRFDRTAGTARLVSATDVFDAEETRLLLEFCDRIGLEFGDLDVLRDRSDGRIHVIDANPTPGGPGGPGGGYTAEQRRLLLETQLAALDRYFLQVLEASRDTARAASAAPSGRA